MTMILGTERLITEPDWHHGLRGRRVALLGHAASVNHIGRHTLDTLHLLSDIQITAAFGPQHGLRGDKQDNMVESADDHDSQYHIPIWSLYGTTRRLTDAMLDQFDVLLVDLQDLGTRIYTYLATVAYALEDCANRGKAVWILDRPNPLGRIVEGNCLKPGWHSFVGAVAVPMRYGLTLGELARWLVAQHGWSLDLQIIPMHGYAPEAAPGFGWPLAELPWVNPSPNASSLNMARCFPGTVLLEGTTLSEGRGTTTPLEVVGAPDLDVNAILRCMEQLRADWLAGALIRCCAFEPVFHKHQGHLCHGIQLHTDNHQYDPQQFRPYRFMALWLKAVRLTYPDYPLWRVFTYEYESERLAIDLLTGSDFLRRWVDDPAATPEDLEAYLEPDERAWREQRQAFLFYSSEAC
jgi:uncharacterized protein YbbC (DUF1343 family)